MPTYQYRCEKCGKTFECTETMSEHEAAKPFPFVWKDCRERHNGIPLRPNPLKAGPS